MVISEYIRRMRIADIITHLESICPPALQESYDNAGLICGDARWEATSALITLDCTEPIVEEAIRRGCNLVISHHPILFHSLKRITGTDYVQRALIKAIKHDIAIYAAHTNLDNVLAGVNRRICDKLGLQKVRILSPKKGILRKLVTFVPLTHLDEVRAAVFAAGAGVVGNYDWCSFNVEGYGTFRGGEGTDPFVGKRGEFHKEKEARIEVILPSWLQDRVRAALLDAHPYDEVAYDIVPLENAHPQVGSGMIGELPEPLAVPEFLDHLKASMDLSLIRHTSFPRAVSRVAVCGGAGSFLLHEAMAQGAEAFVSADFSYHQFFDADQKIMIADIGHYESERYTMELLRDLLLLKMPTFAALLTELNTNPVSYFS
jgi:dinuclear metal center YbgI/SA1388 family protein